MLQCFSDGAAGLVAAEGGAGKLDGLKDLVTTAGGSLQAALPKKLADPQHSLVGP